MPGLMRPRTDAERLLCSILSLDRTACYLDGREPLRPKVWEQFADYVARRTGREPLQYILGEVEFGPLRLRVDSRVLIPRPETELLAEAAIRFTRAMPPGTWVWDIGTGSGAIALAIAHDAHDHPVIASDRSQDAVTLARENAAQSGLADRIRWLVADVVQPVRRRSLPRLGGIVSNPPYIAQSDFAYLAPEVARWEPRLALDGGQDGLRYYPALVAAAAELLPSDGFFICEVGDGQADVVTALLAARCEFGRITVIHDLGGVKRVITAIRR